MPNIDPGPLTGPVDPGLSLSQMTLPTSFDAPAGGGFSLASTSFSGLGSAVGDIFGGIGDLQEASAYKQAAKYSLVNAGIARESERIQLTQANRQINKVLGGQQAEFGGANLKTSGSAIGVMRNSASQGALQKAIIQEQGEINVTGYEQAATQYQAMASSAKASGIGSIFGGVIGAIGSIFSDMRLKHNVNFSYTRPDGINIYTFSYKGSSDVWSGVVAQDVQRLRPDAVGVEDGYLTVDYDKLGLLPLKVA